MKNLKLKSKKLKSLSFDKKSLKGDLTPQVAGGSNTNTQICIPSLYRVCPIHVLQD